MVRAKQRIYFLNPGGSIHEGIVQRVSEDGERILVKTEGGQAYPIHPSTIRNLTEGLWPSGKGEEMRSEGDNRQYGRVGDFIVIDTPEGEILSKIESISEETRSLTAMFGGNLRSLRFRDVEVATRSDVQRLSAGGEAIPVEPTDPVEKRARESMIRSRAWMFLESANRPTPPDYLACTGHLRSVGAQLERWLSKGGSLRHYQRLFSDGVSLSTRAATLRELESELIGGPACY